MSTSKQESSAACVIHNSSKHDLEISSYPVCGTLHQKHMSIVPSKSSTFLVMKTVENDLVNASLKIVPHKESAPESEDAVAKEIPLLIKFHGHPCIATKDAKYTGFEYELINNECKNSKISVNPLHEEKASESCPIHTMEYSIKDD